LSTEYGQIIGLLDTLTLRKTVKQTPQFRGERVSEGYSENEPDLVLRKDEITPKEVISVKMSDAQTLDVSRECGKEIAFASKYGLTKLHLVVTDKAKNKVFDNLADFAEIVNLRSKLDELSFRLAKKPEKPANPCVMYI
jgi:predicted molibdopterin-dependent oxidoreductase YjgC